MPGHVHFQGRAGPTRPEDPGPVIGGAGPGPREGRGPRASATLLQLCRGEGPGCRRGPWSGSPGPSLPHSRVARHPHPLCHFIRGSQMAWGRVASRAL